MISKVRCVNQGKYVYITAGKEYNVLKIEDDYFHIWNNSGEVCFYEKHLFVVPENNSKYILVEGKKDDFIQQVNELIAQGYKPQGGVAVDQQFYIQALVLNEQC